MYVTYLLLSVKSLICVLLIIYTYYLLNIFDTDEKKKDGRIFNEILNIYL